MIFLSSTFMTWDCADFTCVDWNQRKTENWKRLQEYVYVTCYSRERQLPNRYVQLTEMVIEKLKTPFGFKGNNILFWISMGFFVFGFLIYGIYRLSGLLPSESEW